MTWHEGLQVLVISGEFGGGVSGSPPYTTGKASVHSNRDASCCCQSCPPLGALENQANDFNVSSNGRKENHGLDVLVFDMGHQIRGFALASVACHLLYFYSIYFI